MRKFSHLAETLKGSEIVKLGNEIKARVANGEHIYNFTIGDFSPAIFPIPEKLRDWVIQSYTEGHTNYPPANGLQELREGVSRMVKEFEGLDYSPEEILIGSGGRPMIYSIFKTLVDRGDKVVYAVPSWNNNHYVQMNEAEHCVIKTVAEHNFMPSAEDIRPYIHEARLICLCSPQNPTGTTISEAGLKEICALILEENRRRGADGRQVFLMYDQMYYTLTFNGTRHFTPVGVEPAMKDFTIFVDGISKAFSATGLRVGWAMGPADVIAKMKSLLTHVGAWAPMAEQWATAQYLKDMEEVHRFNREVTGKLHDRLVLIYEGIQKLKAEGYPVDAIAPQAGIYLTVKIDLIGRSAAKYTLHTSNDVFNYLLNEAGLALVPFSAFGAPEDREWFRLSIGTCDIEEIPTMLQKLENALAAICKENVIS